MPADERFAQFNEFASPMSSLGKGGMGATAGCGWQSASPQRRGREHNLEGTPASWKSSTLRGRHGTTEAASVRGQHPSKGRRPRTLEQAGTTSRRLRGTSAWGKCKSEPPGSPSRQPSVDYAETAGSFTTGQSNISSIMCVSVFQQGRWRGG